LKVFPVKVPRTDDVYEYLFIVFTNARGRWGGGLIVSLIVTGAQVNETISSLKRKEA
jgi:hypothetical protein